MAMEDNKFIRKFTHEDKINEVLDTKNIERMYNILEDITGDGVRIEKPTENNGLGWKIVVDGHMSDSPTMETDKRGEKPLPIDIISASEGAYGDYDNYHGEAQYWLGLDLKTLEPFVPFAGTIEYLHMETGVFTSTKSTQGDVYLAAQMLGVDEKPYWLIHGNNYGYFFNEPPHDPQPEGIMLTEEEENDDYAGRPWILQNWNNGVQEYLSQYMVESREFSFLGLDEWIPEEIRKQGSEAVSEWLIENPHHVDFIQASSWLIPTQYLITETTRREVEERICDFVEGIRPYYQHYCGSPIYEIPEVKREWKDGHWVMPTFEVQSSLSDSVPLYASGSEWGGTIDQWLEYNGVQLEVVKDLIKDVEETKERLTDDMIDKFNDYSSEIDNFISTIKTRTDYWQEFMDSTLVEWESAISTIATNIVQIEQGCTNLDNMFDSLQNRIEIYRRTHP